MNRINLTRLFTALLVVCMLVSTAVFPAMAATIPEATVDVDADCSLTIYKYDYTNAAKDGIWSQKSYVSTGQYDKDVNNVLGNPNIESNLGNGQKAYGYAIAGVEFTYLKVADFYQFSENGTVSLLYKFDKVLAAGLMKAIGLENGAGSNENANALKENEGYWCYQSDVVVAALAQALSSNATTVKNALESYVKANGGTAMNPTNEYGCSAAADLEVGLYLLVETQVPEMVTSTTNPFFVSLPMTTVNGGIVDEEGNTSTVTTGGHDWNYDVTVYPKNETGIVTLEKTVREAVKSTGTNKGSSTDISDGYAHNATASTGDTVEYQIISTLPSITSDATAISEYTFQDVLASGLSYDSTTPVQIEWYTDSACTDLVTTWSKDSGLFDVKTIDNQDGSHTMTVSMTDAGLAVINATNTVASNSNGSLYAGYSNYTMRITYAAVLDSDASVVYGDAGNCNKVVLTWRRTNSAYCDTLIDDCHIYTYGINLTKTFSDGKSDQSLFDHVLFKVQNASDGYYVVADLNKDEGVWYVTGYTKEENAATAINPVEWNKKAGQVVIKGLEDDEYTLTEIETADKYSLLADSASVVITATDDATRSCKVYSTDALGVIQNDSRYSFNGGLDLKLANIPQSKLAHNYLTASATFNGESIAMIADDVDKDSANALVSLTVINNVDYTMPGTGDDSFQKMLICGTAMLVSSLCCIVFLAVGKKRKKEQQER